MNKILLIARRDYLQTVLSKAYLIGLIIPLFFAAGIFGVSLLNRIPAKLQRIALVDRTGISAAAVIQACRESNRKMMFNPATGLQVMPRFIFEELKPETDQAAQLLSLSDRVRRGELFVLLDISPGALRLAENDQLDPVHYYTNSAGFDQLGLWLPAAVNDGLRRVRLAQLRVDEARVREVLRDVPVVSMNLMTKDPGTGKILPGEKKNPLQARAIPLFLVVLLLMVVVIGSAPQLGAVPEDKIQRVFEMLLASASPFDLMMGKVLAALGASLTSSIVYVGGALLALAGMSMFGIAPLGLLPWFFAYLIADVLMLSAWGVAIGSACGTPQDAQSLAFLLFLPIMVPVFVMTLVMQQPNGVLAIVMSFIPPFTPVIMLLRQALPGGVPWWQPLLGLLGAIAFTVAVIWAAARIFRIGILSQGTTPKLAELARWVLRG